MSIPVEQLDPVSRRIGPGRRKPTRHRKAKRSIKATPSTGPPPAEATIGHNGGPPLTLSVPEAGRRYFNLGRNASYAAAERGDIPTVRIGKIIRVPVRAVERMLDAATPKMEAVK
jgi:hypothetical protein